MLYLQDPIDLGLIGERLASRAFYISLEQFVADVCRCFNNSKARAVRSTNAPRRPRASAIHSPPRCC
jgi:hypothetical protein